MKPNELHVRIVRQQYRHKARGVHRKENPSRHEHDGNFYIAAPWTRRLG